MHSKHQRLPCKQKFFWCQIWKLARFSSLCVEMHFSQQNRKEKPIIDLGPSWFVFITLEELKKQWNGCEMIKVLLIFGVVCGRQRVTTIAASCRLPVVNLYMFIAALVSFTHVMSTLLQAPQKPNWMIRKTLYIVRWLHSCHDGKRSQIKKAFKLNHHNYYFAFFTQRILFFWWVHKMFDTYLKRILLIKKKNAKSVPPPFLGAVG